MNADKAAQLWKGYQGATGTPGMKAASDRIRQIATPAKTSQPAASPDTAIERRIARGGNNG